MATEEKIKVMQAYLDGKPIEMRTVFHGNKGIWMDCDIEPFWDWSKMEYRIKPEEKKPIYRPYKDTEEMIEDYKERFEVNNPPYTMPLIWIESKHSKPKSLIGRFNGPTVEIDTWVLNMDDLYLDHCYLDGSPCGKLVE